MDQKLQTSPNQNRDNQMKISFPDYTNHLVISPRVGNSLVSMTMPFPVWITLGYGCEFFLAPMLKIVSGVLGSSFLLGFFVYRTV
jgi:hypothetical protein